MYMEIYFLGHSSFKLKGKTTSVVIDPFDPKNVGLKYSGVEGDIVTVSHNHDDHNQSQLVAGARKILKGPGEYEIQGVTVLGFPSYHDDKKGEEKGKNTIYVYEIDGLRLCHLGDLGHQLSESLIGDIGDIDILMIPVGGGSSLNSESAVKVAQAIEPRIIIPMHYQEEGLNQTNFGHLNTYDEFVKDMGLPVETLPKLSIKKEEFGEEQKVVVLERK